MRITISNFGSIKHLAENFSPGVHLITGPSTSGKSMVCKAMKWALTGNAHLADGYVEVVLPGSGVIMRECKSGVDSARIVDTDGVVVNDPGTFLRARGFIPEIFGSGARLLIGGLPTEPPLAVRVNNQEYAINNINLAEAKEKFQRLLQEKMDIQMMVDRTESMKFELEKEVTVLRADILALYDQERAQGDHALYHLMKSGECPIYQITCTCKDQNIARMKEEVKGRLVDKSDIPGFHDKLRLLERELMKKELYIEILKKGLPDGSNKPASERLNGINSKVAIGKVIIKAVEDRDAWRRQMQQYQPIMALKDELVKIARSLSLDLGFDNGFILGGKPILEMCRAEEVVLNYCLQRASGAPVIIVDDFDVLDLSLKEKLLADARTCNKYVILTVLSSSPRQVPNICSWHLSDGKLSAAGRYAAAG